MISTAGTVKLGTDAIAGEPLQLWPTSGVDDVQIVIRAAYRQVWGNAHVMDSERLASAESQLCDRSISVREFVRTLAKSDFYRARFFEGCAPYRFVELNFKHLLGRAPQDQAEISEHLCRCIEQGYDAEIDSYIDSVEYAESFGEEIVPYYRTLVSQVGQKQVAYNRLFSLFRGPAEVDSAIKSSALVRALGTDSTSKIQLPSDPGRVAGAADATDKMFKITVAGATGGGRRRRTTNTYMVSGGNMTPRIQQINRTGGKIVSIVEIG